MRPHGETQSARFKGPGFLREGAKHFIFVLGIFLIGCSAVARTRSTPLLNRDASREKPQEVMTAVEALAGALGGQNMNSEDLARVARQVEKDAKARSAVEVIANALGPSRAVVKYCPADGKRFDSQHVRCPEHDVELKTLEE